MSRVSSASVVRARDYQWFSLEPLSPSIHWKCHTWSSARRALVLDIDSTFDLRLIVECCSTTIVLRPTSLVVVVVVVRRRSSCPTDTTADTMHSDCIDVREMRSSKSPVDVGWLRWPRASIPRRLNYSRDNVRRMTNDIDQEDDWEVDCKRHRSHWTDRYSKGSPVGCWNQRKEWTKDDRHVTSIQSQTNFESMFKPSQGKGFEITVIDEAQLFNRDAQSMLTVILREKELKNRSRYDEFEENSLSLPTRTDLIMYS